MHIRSFASSSRKSISAISTVVGGLLLLLAVIDTHASERNDLAVQATSDRQKAAFQRVRADSVRVAHDEIPFVVRGSQRSVQGVADVISFLDDVYELHTATSDMGFEVIKETSFDGGKNYEVRRVVNGIPVLGSNTVVSVGNDGKVSSSYGLLYRADTANLSTPNILTGTAIESCRATSDSKFTEEFNWDDKLELGYKPTDGSLRLGWFGKSRKTGDLARVECFVDAETGVTDVLSADLGAMNREIRDASDGANPVLMRAEGDPATGDLDVDLAYAYLGSFYNFFDNLHNRDGYDDNGILMSVGVHTIANASDGYNVTVFSDSEPNASYHAGSLIHAARDRDIAHHEFAHNLIGHEAELSLLNESKALRESLADIFAASTSSYLAGWSTANSVWEIGETSFSNGALRYLHNPIQSGGIAWYHNRIPTHDIYQLSGVVSMMFKLLATGGANPAASTLDRNGNIVPNIEVQALGVAQAEQLVYFTLDSGFLPNHATFHIAHVAMETASAVLWAGQPVKQGAVNDAWAAVGFDHPEQDYEVFWLSFCFGDSVFVASIEIGASIGAVSGRQRSSPQFCFAIAIETGH